MSAVNFLKRKVHVRSTVLDVNGTMVVGPPKTGERVVSVPSFIADVMAEQIARYPDPEGFVFGAYQVAVRCGGGPTSAAESSDRPLGERDWSRYVHDLRHTAASLAIEAGAHPELPGAPRSLLDHDHSRPIRPPATRHGRSTRREDGWGWTSSTRRRRRSRRLIPAAFVGI